MSAYPLGMMPIPSWLLWLAGAYLVGSVPFSLLIGLAQGVDIRKHGSGNVGASNAGRILGKKWGLLVFGLDVLKGCLPVVGYGLSSGMVAGGTAAATGGFANMGANDLWPTLMWLAVGVTAVLGHVFPIWLRFRGGKGVATGLGAMLGLWPVVTLPAVAALFLWVGVTKATGYISVGSIAAALAIPLLVVPSGLLMGRGGAEILILLTVTCLLAALVIFRHRDNLARLRTGTEGKTAWTGKGGD